MPRACLHGDLERIRPTDRGTDQVRGGNHLPVGTLIPGHRAPHVAGLAENRLQIRPLEIAVNRVILDEQGRPGPLQRSAQSAQRVQVRALHVQLDEVRGDVPEHVIQRPGQDRAAGFTGFIHAAVKDPGRAAGHLPVRIQQVQPCLVVPGGHLQHVHIRDVVQRDVRAQHCGGLRVRLHRNDPRRLPGQS